MSESFLSLDTASRGELLAYAAAESGRLESVLEKDVVVVWVLSVLFEAPIGAHLCFKGGTSLSKAHRIIERFSEDVDLTYDIRELLGEERTGPAPDPLPRNRSQAQKWRDDVETELERWVRGVARSTIEEAVRREGLPFRLELVDRHSLAVHYDPAASYGDYMSARVLVEFGGRSTGEPMRDVRIWCDAAHLFRDVSFPDASPRVMSAERTFWEKATLAHAFCRARIAPNSDRFARHWSDLARLGAAGVVDTALTSPDLAERVAEWKNAFYRAKDDSGDAIDYLDAVRGGLRLVPEGVGRSRLRDDYERMRSAGLLEPDAPAFEDVVLVCREIQDRVNGWAGSLGVR